ncbi:hypothetical protein Q5741_07895 [Paenibacillus sp. JX-17]|uniref:Uncharacterized protein n=1 Tax=Paenibacillus lacisoli TaxID=3064525 RepID=A0ABT9CCF8_9BACL|nr:hypothetical protein [Paenibacillus sp. JX-17]MDO7906339.1 hypothetical protein [Paenibacillus sp. JX-17]
MYFLFLLVCLLFSFIFIFKNDRERYLTHIALLTMIVCISLSVLLVNLAVFVGADNSTLFLSVFEMQEASMFNVIKVMVTIGLIAMVVYFYSKQRDE